MKKDDPLLIRMTLKSKFSMVEEESLIRMSARDWCWLLELMDAPAKPNKQLQAAMHR